jgi:hypothetical protein
MDLELGGSAQGKISAKRKMRHLEASRGRGAKDIRGSVDVRLARGQQGDSENQAPRQDNKDLAYSVNGAKWFSKLDIT